NTYVIIMILVIKCKKPLRERGGIMSTNQIGGEHFSAIAASSNDSDQRTGRERWPELLPKPSKLATAKGC
ncbi:hypothetical protein, partial [Ferrovum myxofaciens]|uniref:hypothetical protein n=1 Tax=Ferrovum myxofaciens TaxID=416213 RepID=UPI00055125BA